MSPEQVFDLFQSRNWVDKHNTSTCEYQIKHIYKKGYKRPKNRTKLCEWLRKNNICVGEICKFFKGGSLW